jgi:hypothetical protein
MTKNCIKVHVSKQQKEVSYTFLHSSYIFQVFIMIANIGAPNYVTGTCVFHS